jgi:hypothetical protein
MLSSVVLVRRATLDHPQQQFASPRLRVYAAYSLAPRQRVPGLHKV